MMSSYKLASPVRFRYALFGAACCSLLAVFGPTADSPAVAQAQPAAGDRPAAVLDGQAIGWPEVAPLLAEAAGAVVLEEVVLERALEQACVDRSIRVDDAAIRFERELLVGSLARAAQLPASEGEGLLVEIRTSRGLGERRFAGLLKRNAMLRAMVKQEAGPSGVEVSEEDVEQAFRLRYGPRVRARIILVRSQSEASEASRRLAAGEVFADVAATLSADPSRFRGGLLDPISPADPNYPVAFRRALEDTEVGALSAPIMVTWNELPGFAIVRVEERIAGAETDRAAVAAELRDEVRAVRERAMMDRLARSLIDAQAAKLSVMDHELEWSWRSRRGNNR